jgi:hypothetical protein
MRIHLKTAALAAAVATASLSASAQVTALSHDPLMNKIMSRELRLPAGGVSGAVRIGSGQAIALSFADPLAPLKPTEGLAVKPTPSKIRRAVRRADEQLKTMSTDPRRADWSGRK